MTWVTPVPSISVVRWSYDGELIEGA